MTAETLAIALVVLVGATVVSMVKEFFSKPWHMEEGTIYIEGRAYQPVRAVVQPQPLPTPVPQPLPVPAYQAARLEAPRREPIPAPILALAAESRG
jgi:hypothetical protein